MNRTMNTQVDRKTPFGPPLVRGEEKRELRPLGSKCCNTLGRFLAALSVAILGHQTVSAQPIPIGESTVTVAYPTTGGSESFSADRDFRGTYFPDALPLDDAPNIKMFQAVNAYGRRVNVSNQFPDVIGDNESVVAHGFLKIDNNGDYFPGIPADGTVSVRIENIRFSEPVHLDESTFLFHTFWDLNQSDRLDRFYDHPHNLHTLTDAFRNEEEFRMAHEIVENPAPHHVFGDLGPLVTITGQDTDTLSILVEIPYEMFKHLHEEGQMVPDDLPAPHGFLEPYHFHLEYVVAAVPEPGSLILLGAAMLLGGWRRGSHPPLRISRKPGHSRTAFKKID